jgi:hypothetical protein
MLSVLRGDRVKATAPRPSIAPSCLDYRGLDNVSLCFRRFRTLRPKASKNACIKKCPSWSLSTELKAHKL